MPDDENGGDKHRAFLAGLDEDGRIARSQAMSDEQVGYYFSLLSGVRIMRNVLSLSLLEAEMRARNLPAGRCH